jgi:hypothetical protein
MFSRIDPLKINHLMAAKDPFKDRWRFALFEKTLRIYILLKHYISPYDRLKAGLFQRLNFIFGAQIEGGWLYGIPDPAGL